MRGPGDRQLRWSAWGLRGIVAATGAWLLVAGDLVLAATAVLLLALSLVLPVVHRLTRVPIPGLVDALVAAASAAHLFGHTLGLYGSFEHYDKVLHLVVGATLALIVYLATAAWCRAHPDYALPPVGLGVATVGLTAFSAVIWECLEFAVDALLNLNNQQSLADTMADLAVTVAGGSVMAIVGHRIVLGHGVLSASRAAVECGMRAVLARRWAAARRAAWNRRHGDAPPSPARDTPASSPRSGRRWPGRSSAGGGRE